MRNHPQRPATHPAGGAHHIRHVANVGIGEFLAPILPHFEWMYVPGHSALYPRRRIVARADAMFRAGEEHEAIYFLKQLAPGWPEHVRAQVEPGDA